MNVLLSLSLWLALIMLSCCVDVGSDETEEPPTDYYDDATVTPTPDYDYNSTFDYYYVTGIYDVKGTNEEGGESENHLPKVDGISGVSGKASGIGRWSPVLLLGLAVLLMWH